MARRRQSRWASEAALQAFLRFNPEEAGLRELQRSAQGTYETTVKQARGTAQGIQSSIGQAAPQVARAYDEAGFRQAQIANDLRTDVANLGGEVPRAIRSAIASETATGGRQIWQGKAQDLSGLMTRSVAAKEGEAFAIANARNQLVGDLTKVLTRKQDLRREKGAFTALTTQQLSEAARKEAQKLDLAMAQLEQSDRNSRRTANTSRQNATLRAQVQREAAAQRAATARSKTSASGKRLLSPDKHLSYQETINEIRARARKYKGKPRQEIVKKLMEGRAQQTIRKNPRTGEDLKNPVTLPRIPAYKPDIRMTAALDVELDGHLSRKTARKLQAAGFRVRDLNLPTYTEWKRQQGRGPLRRRGN